MTDAKNRLKDIQVDELSLVDRAANKRRFIFMKRSDGMPEGEMTADIKQATLRMLTEGLEKLTSLVERVKQTPEGGASEGKTPAPAEMLQSLEAVMQMLTAAKEQHTPETKEEKDNAEKGDVEKGPKTVMEALERLQSVVNALGELQEGAEMPAELTREVSAIGQLLMGSYPSYPSPQKSSKADTDREDRSAQEDAVEKIDLEQIPEEFRDKVAQLEKRNVEAAEETAELRKQLQEERDARELKEMKEYISATYKNLPKVKVDEFAPVLKSLKDKAPEEVAKLEEILKAADEGLEKGALFAELAPQNPELDADSPYGQIEKLAEELIQKTDKPLTKPQAIDKVLQTPAGRRLYEEHQASQN